MAFDSPTRNRLARFVAHCRTLLTDEFTRQMKNDFGFDPDSEKLPDEQDLAHLDDAGRETARLLRDTTRHYLAAADQSTPAKAKKARHEVLNRIVREQAFTVLNRLCALRMAEARELMIESVANGYQAKGFQLYDRLAGTALGETGDAYRSFLFSVFDELAVDLPVLFDRFSPQGRLFPRESVLLTLLDQINHPDLEPLWPEDETIGWIYQYFNTPEERRQMRAESQAPRNSRELAVRNQFFTPRYVVEFLTDNTLGRIWYEMTQGQTSLKDSCLYLVRRPDEVFLSSMTDADAESPAEGSIRMAKLLQEGSEEDWPEFDASDESVQSMIDMAHCVDGYVRHPHGGDWEEWFSTITETLRTGRLAGISTQELLDGLFMVCRNDRHGGDGSVYSEHWFVATCNEVRRRALKSREPDLAQEELLRQPVFVPYRPLKDPREIRMLDPACGSMHFGLYAFDLFERIYAEYFSGPLDQNDEETDEAEAARPQPDDYAHLIIEHNIHGIDIDPRAVQIAGLSLWLRAQRSWRDMGIMAQDRPRIERSNVVCAEPMPGDEALLDEFLKSLQQDRLESLIRRVLGVPETQQIRATERMAEALCGLVKTVWQEMKLAGEAGSLLKIEDALRDAIEAGRTEWEEQHPLFRMVEFGLHGEAPKTKYLRIIPGEEDDFWNRAEAIVLAALESYAEQAQNGSGFQRRLFAQDAARGFAFIDACRKRFDLVLMNPPFGEPTRSVFNYLDTVAKRCKTEILTAFVEIAGYRLTSNGFLGAITKREPLFTSAFTKWRAGNLFGDNLVSLVSDLGGGVLDNAMVETSAYVVTRSAGEHVLGCSISEHDDNAGSRVAMRCVHRKTLQRIPNSPIALDVPDSVLSAFDRLSPLDPTYGSTAQGASTTDDFRFCRLWFEVPLSNLRRVSDETESQNDLWTPFAKGEPATPFYGDVPVAIKWGRSGAEVKEYNRMRYGSASRNITNQEFYGRCGIVFPRRTSNFRPRVLPSGCVFSKGGQSIYPSIEVETALCLLSHPLIDSLIQPMLGGADMDAQYEVGIVGKIPMPRILENETAQLGELVAPLINTWAELYSQSESSPDFRGLHFASNLCEFINYYQQHLTTASAAYVEGYGQLLEVVSRHYAQSTRHDIPFDAPEARLHVPTERELVERWLMFRLGVAMGRFSKKEPTQNQMDYRRASLHPPASTYAESVSPGMLSVDSINRLSGYLIEEGDQHSYSRATSILNGEQSGLDDWLEEHLFEIHVDRYSGFLRTAPIYWPLSTQSRSYTIWFYYHRLTDQSVYKAVNDFVDPKVKETNRQLADLQAIKDRSSAQEKELAKLTELDAELEQFKADLLEIAAFWKPNLNDGVQITAAPLWKLFQHRAWQRKLKDTWENLEVGEYDWAHLAMSIWPARVVPKCVTDRSLAIAHELEDLFWVEDTGHAVGTAAPTGRGRRRRSATAESSSPIGQALRCGDARNLCEPDEEIDEQKRRQRSPQRDRVRTLLEQLATEHKSERTGNVYQHLASGDWDHEPVALMFWPERVAEECWDNAQLAAKHKLSTPARRTKANRKRFIDELVAKGCPDLADQLATAMECHDEPFQQLWKELSDGTRDHEPLALALWPDRVVDKCTKDVELAQTHNIHRFFWVQHPTQTWRRRTSPAEEVKNEIERRSK